MHSFSQNKMSGTFRYFLTVMILLCAFLPTLTAQVTTLNDWTELYYGTGNPGNMTYTVPTGSGDYRLLVVGVATTRSNNGSRTVAITYGGQTLTPVDGDLTNSMRQHTQLYYLNEAGLDAASNSTLSVAISGGTTTRNGVFAAVYDNVDQVNPITNSRNYNSGKY